MSNYFPESTCANMRFCKGDLYMGLKNHMPYLQFQTPATTTSWYHTYLEFTNTKSFLQVHIVINIHGFCEYIG